MWRALPVALALVLVPRAGRAQDLELPEAGRLFEYQSAHEKYYLRAVLEEVGVLGAGLAHYYSQRDANSVDWDLNYDWPSLRSKLVGDAYAFDTNRFDTNFVTHPGSGILYYFGARSNRLSVLESLGFAFAASTLWEFLGEFREQVSVNDLFVTPLAGSAIAESTIELGAFFDRSCETTANQVLGSLFGPAKSLHDAVDGLKPRRASECDRYGLATRGGRRLRLFAGSAAVFGHSSSGASGETRFGGSAEIANLGSLSSAGRGWHGFSDGNISSLAVSMGLESRRISDFSIGARMVPAGLHYRDLNAARELGRSGSEVVVGFLIGTEYSQHRYERPHGALDRVFVLDAPATTLTFIAHRGPERLELGFDAGFVLAGIDSFALDEYLAGHSGDRLPSVTRAQGYSHAMGFALTPRARLFLGSVELGLEGRTDRLYGLRVLDRSPEADVRAAPNEVRRRGMLWLSVGPETAFPRFTVFADGRQRSGTIAETEKSRSELALGASVDALF